MASSEIKTVIESQQAKGLSALDPVTIPGFGPSTPADAFDPMNYKFRYAKIDFDDLGSLAELEILETRAIRNQGVYILSKDRYPFMDKVFMIVGYLEKETDAI